MRRLLVRVTALLVVLDAAAASAQQQGSVQLSTSTQVLTGDPDRIGDQARVTPDFLVRWVQPTFRFGTLQIDFGVTREDDRAVPGRAFVGLRDVKALGLTWDIQGGDTSLIPPVSAHGFANLRAPAVTFRGGSVRARSQQTALDVTAGRTTAMRNIFGSQPDPLDQRTGLVRVSHWMTPRLRVAARASKIRTRDLGEFPHFISNSTSAGASVTVRPTSNLQLVAEGSYSWYRRRGADAPERDPSGLVGAIWAHRRGWVQLTAQRFSPGAFPVLNYQYRDQEGLFAVGEYTVGPVRLFGGGNTTRTNLDPLASVKAGSTLPRTTAQRAFGGVRFPLTDRTTVTLRYEDGTRAALPVVPGRSTDTDTGAGSAEVRTSFSKWSLVGRYQRRDNVERLSEVGSYTQHDVWLQAYFNPSRASQLFGSAMWTSRRDTAGGGEDFWQVSGGGQAQIPRHDLWLRAEVSASRSLDVASDSLTPRHVLNLGLSGRLTPRTSLSLDAYLDRAPLGLSNAGPWASRSMIRLVHTIPTGGVRVPELTADGRPALDRRRGTGTVAGLVFVDWNADGVRNDDEDTLAGIAVELEGLARATSGTRGTFEFADVPVGPGMVGVDVSAIPVDYDIPDVPQVEVDIGRNATSTVSFALVPLGSIAGRVWRDANGNSTADEGDEPIDDALVVLDGGQRTELVRGGRFRFDAIRAGEHQLRVLSESLPAGAQILGAPEVGVTVGRDQLDRTVTFLVDVKQRAEIRRVFPAPGTSAARAVPLSPPRPAAPAAPEAPSAIDLFDVQVAAVSRLDRAQVLAADLRSRGWDAFVIQPAPGGADGFYRVRVGAYAGRDAAERAGRAIETALGTPVRVNVETPEAPSPLHVQIAAFATEDRAWALVERLEGLGFDAYLLVPAPGGADRLYRVRAGAFATRSEAQTAAAAIGHALGFEVWVTRDHPSPARTATARPPAAGAASTFAIQLAAPARAESASMLLTRARAAGFDAYVIAPTPGDATPLYRVRIGGYPTRAAATAAAAVVESVLGIETWITEEAGTSQQ
jgi:cell division septation protein DedD